MPFGIDFDAEAVKADIQAFLKDFGISYLSEYRVSLVNDTLGNLEGGEEDGGEEAKAADGGLKLLDPSAAGDEDEDGGFAPAAPEHEGQLSMRSRIRKKFKKRFVAISPEFELIMYSDASKKKELGRLNLWRYKTQLCNERPKGKRRGGPQWVEDEERDHCSNKECPKADKPFGGLRRKHHCRACGEIFCGVCSGEELELPHFGYEGPVRVCGPCFEKGRTRARGESFAVQQPEKKDEEEVQFFGINLLHSTRTPHVLECPSEEDRQRWVSVINICCKHATAPVNPDPTMAAAFEAAHRNASLALGLRGKWSITGSEGEMIADLLLYKLTTSVLDPLFSSLPEEKFSPRVKKMAAQKITGTVRSMVAAAVEPAWELAVKGAAAAKEPVSKAIAPILKKIGDAKAKLLEKLKEKTMNVIGPAMEKKGAPLMDRVLKILLKPLVAAYNFLFAAFQKIALRLGKENEKEGGDDKKKSLRDRIRAAMKSLQGEDGEMGPIHKALGGLVDKLKEQQQEHEALRFLQVSKTVNDLLASMHSLMDRALYTFAKHEANDGTEAGAAKALEDVRPALLNDSQVQMRTAVHGFLVGATLPAVQSVVLGNEVVSGAIEAVDGLVPEALAEYVSAGNALEGLVENVVDESVGVLVENGTTNAAGELAAGMEKAAA